MDRTDIYEVPKIRIRKQDLSKKAVGDLKYAIGDTGGLPEGLSETAFPLAILSVLGMAGFKAIQPNSHLAELILIAPALVTVQELNKRYSTVITKPSFLKAYPEIHGEVELPKIETMLTDGIRGVHGMYLDKDDWRQKIYPLDNYKKMIFSQVAQKIEEGQLAKFAWTVALKSPDPDIKLQAVDILLKKCKSTMKNAITSNSLPLKDNSELEAVIIRKLKQDWGNNTTDINPLSATLNEPNLINLKRENIFLNAESISQEIQTELNLPPTLIPFMKLFVLRHVIDQIKSNRIPSPHDSTFVLNIMNKFKDRMRISKVLEQEQRYSPEEVTTGIEMQPDRPKNKLGFTEVNLEDIKKIIKYAGLKYQDDMPFEIVFPPTRTPIVSVLMLREILLLTGVSIENAGIQINFGGISNEGNIRALQRLMIAENRLTVPNINLYGPYWDLKSSQKSEINIREIGQGTISITPKDPEHPEFQYVAEYRAPIGSNNLLLFIEVYWLRTNWLAQQKP